MITMETGEENLMNIKEINTESTTKSQRGKHNWRAK